ncbi:MAG: hypothetical protein K6E30_01985 [Lachnospiraceae bacterium]|nr:hypothetical protein [Lachnospiraceae bacterium]
MEGKRRKVKGAQLAAFALAVFAFTGCGPFAYYSDSYGMESVMEESEPEGALPTADFGDLRGEYEPEEGYDEYTLSEYTIEDAGVTFVATVSRKSDDSAYYIHFNYLGDEQAAGLDGDLNILYDMTGFLEEDAALIVMQCREEDKWAPIAKGAGYGE